MTIQSFASLALISSLLLTTASSAQSPGDLLHYGKGCPTSKGKPVTLKGTAPNIGKPFSLTVSNCRGASPVLLLFGASPRNIDLGPLGAPGCRLYSSGEVGIPMFTDASGAATMRVPIPNSTKLLGSVFYCQFLVADPINRFGIVSSNGARGTVGKI